MSTSTGGQRDTVLLTRQIETFYQGNRFIGSIDNLNELLNLIMQESETAVGAEASCIAIYDPSDDRSHIEFTTSEKSEGGRSVSLAMGQGILGEVAVTHTPRLAYSPRRCVNFLLPGQTGKGSLLQTRQGVSA